MTEMALRTRRRPPVYRLKGRVAGIVAIGTLGFFSDGWWKGSLRSLDALLLAVTWLVAPYSRFAWRVHQPPIERLRRWRSLAEKLTGRRPSVPSFGSGRSTATVP